MKTSIYVAIVIFVTVGTVFSEGLAFSIHANSTAFKIGEQVIFTFTYTNTSNRNVGIYPEYYAYEALDTYFVNKTEQRRGEVIRYLSPALFDCTVVAKKSRILRPGETYSRKLVATLSSSLPSDITWLNKTRGVYVLFADSAIRLPGYGRYDVSSCYVGSKSYAQCLQNPKKRYVWVGKACTEVITIDIHQ
jgi:hypothetical protein